jgi:hypothetical protein
MKFSVLACFAPILCSVAWLQASAQTPRFTALCAHERGQRVDAAAKGEQGRWDAGERWLDPAPWIIRFNGTNRMIIDGREFTAVSRNDSTVMGFMHSSAPGAENGKIWLINTSFERGFFAHLQGSDFHMVGKLHEFRCQISRY